MTMEYAFYGWNHGDVKGVTDEYRRSWTPCRLYDALRDIWCEYTCAPRLRGQWSEENRTVGQCSVTAFLVQDIFGGKVYGILRPGGNYHCYNVVGDCVFDLTSEQFGGEALDYENNPEQFRKVHFAKEEKRLRYEFLKGELKRRFGRETAWDGAGDTAGKTAVGNAAGNNEIRCQGGGFQGGQDSAGEGE